MAELESVSGYAFSRQPLSNITPFTYRDHGTFQRVLYGLIDFINDTHMPEINALVDEIELIINDGAESMNQQLLAAIDQFTTMIADTNTQNQLLVTTTLATLRDEIETSNADNAQLVADTTTLFEAIVESINNKSGPVDIQRATLTAPYTLEINPVWPTNQPVRWALTQDATGGRAVTLGANIVGPLFVNAAPSAVTRFDLIPNGAGQWNVVQIATQVNELVFDPATRSEATPELRLKAAMTATIAAGVERKFRVTEKLVLTDTLVVDLGYVSLELLSGQIDATGVLGKPAIHFLNSRDTNSQLAGGIANNRRSITGLTLLGPGKTNVASVGILFDSLVGNDRGAAFYDMEINSFETGVLFQNNAYLLGFYNFHVYNCKTGVAMPKDFVNYGENIKFIGGGVGSCDRAVWNENSNGNLHFVSTSFDFCPEIAIADRGGIFLAQPHIETNHPTSQLIGPIIKTTANRSKVVLHGGIIMFHTPPTHVDYIFETTNVNWGGGIFMQAVEFFNATSKTGYLCGGTGQIKFNNHVYYDGNGSGAGGGSILTNKANNLLMDGGFDLTEIVDATLTHASATSRTQSASTTLAIAGSELIIDRPAAGIGEVVLYVPVEKGREYASAFTIASSTTTGNLSVNEGFVALGPRDARGIPPVYKIVERSSSTINTGAIVAPTDYAYGSTAWNRVAPSWATHFRLRLNVGVLTVGQLKLSEAVITVR